MKIKPLPPLVSSNAADITQTTYRHEGPLAKLVVNQPPSKASEMREQIYRSSPLRHSKVKSQSGLRVGEELGYLRMYLGEEVEAAVAASASPLLQ